MCVTDQGLNPSRVESATPNLEQMKTLFSSTSTVCVLPHSRSGGKLSTTPFDGASIHTSEDLPCPPSLCASDSRRNSKDKHVEVGPETNVDFLMFIFVFVFIFRFVGGVSRCRRSGPTGNGVVAHRLSVPSRTSEVGRWLIHPWGTNRVLSDSSPQG